MEKILLILESDTRCKALSEALIKYEVCACNADKAPETFMRFCPDVLILDLFLPGIDGFTLMEGNNALLPPAILLLSVLDSDYVRKRATQLGVDFIIRKPCSVDYIVRHLADILMSRQFSDYDTCPSNGVFITTLAAFLRKKYPSRFRKGSRLS